MRAVTRPAVSRSLAHHPLCGDDMTTIRLARAETAICVRPPRSSTVGIDAAVLRNVAYRALTISKRAIVAIALFERLAKDTWERLQSSRTVGLRFAEEGMTDLLLLEIMRQPWDKRTHTWVLIRGKTPKHQEKLYGTDWEWWIGNDQGGWQRYALQAKIIDLNTERYNALGHRVGATQQVDLLEAYAQRVGAIPLYVFYNYTTANVAQIWKCCRRGASAQYGCSIAHLA
jgi:hypothetical protein